MAPFEDAFKDDGSNRPPPRNPKPTPKWVTFLAIAVCVMLVVVLLGLDGLSIWADIKIILNK